MPEERGLYPRMRVRDQLVYLGQLCGQTTRDAQRDVDMWLDRLGLASRATDRLAKLSHGNQQRVQLIAALLNDPELLVLDEPFSGLDPIAMGSMAELLAELARAGAIVLFSSHQLDLVEDLCEDVVIIDHGRVVLSGDLAELRAAVPDRFVDVHYRGRAPDWSRLAAVEVVETVNGRTRLRVEGSATFPPCWPRSAPAPSWFRCPTSLPPCRSCSASRWQHEGLAPRVAGRPPGDAGTQPVTGVLGVDTPHHRGRGRPDHPAGGGQHRRHNQASRPDRCHTRPTSGDHPGSGPRRRNEPAHRPLQHRGRRRAGGAGQHIDVLVIDARRLAWPRRADEKLKAVVTGAIQVDAISTRAAAAGISPEGLSALLAPVPVQNQELGRPPDAAPTTRRSPWSPLGCSCSASPPSAPWCSSGVVEEKASRVVEVLLTRVSARNLLAGKIAGIGLLGLAQIALVALVALLATSAISSVDLPAVRASVAVWVLIWFVLGYALYATAFGALGSLASRVEDAQTVAGPVTVLLIFGFFVSFAAIGSPSTGWATAVSLFPLTAPMAMPGRIAMGVTAWWEPTLAVALSLATIGALVYFGGRLYVRAILHSGATLSVAEAWHGSATPQPEASKPASPRNASWLAMARAGRRTPMTRAPEDSHPLLLTVTVCVGVALGVVVAVLAKDVMVGVIVAALLIAVAAQIAKLWSGHGKVPHP